MKDLEPRFWLGRHEQQIMMRMSSLHYRFRGDSRIDITNVVPQTQYSIMFVPPKGHFSDIVAVSFINGIATSVTFGGSDYLIINKWLEANTEKVENPKFQPIPMSEDMTRILRKDDEFWYNIRVSSKTLQFGITITSRKMYP